MNAKSIVLGLVLILVAEEASALSPTATLDSFEQLPNRDIRITYTLANAPAIVTVEFFTNGVKVAGANVADYVTGAFHRITSDGTHAIVWKAKKGMPNVPRVSLSARLKAWAVDNPPDYLVLALEGDSAVPQYYPEASDLPGTGVLDAKYRTTHLLMKKVLAKGIPWKMGSGDGSSGHEDADDLHQVTLTNNYYLGVFELTQKQWQLTTKSSDAGCFALNGAMRPMERRVDYRRLREAAYWGGTTVEANVYPGLPHSNSVCGRLRFRCANELAFDLPSEAQWEFAARAGQPPGRWNNGSSRFDVYTTQADISSSPPGRYLGNSSTGNYPTADTPESELAILDDAVGTAICGSYPPNAWGFYDMSGNVAEWCLDWHDAQGSWNYEGAEYGRVNGDGWRVLSSGETRTDAGYRVVKGGDWRRSAKYLDAGSRDSDYGATYAKPYFGCRLCVTLP